MTPANWECVNGIAKQNGCASWRVLLRRIATGELVVHANSIRAELVSREIVFREPEQVTLKRHALARAAKILETNALPSGPKAMESLVSACAAGHQLTNRVGAAPLVRPSQAKGKARK